MQQLAACVVKQQYPDTTKKKKGVLETFALFACFNNAFFEKLRKVTIFSFILRLHINDFCKQLRLDSSAVI